MDSDRKRVFTVWRPGVFSRAGFHKQNQYTLSVRIWPSHTSPQCRWAVCHDRQGSSEDSEITRGNFKHLPSVTFLTILRIPFIHSLPAITYLGIRLFYFFAFLIQLLNYILEFPFFYMWVYWLRLGQCIIESLLKSRKRLFILSERKELSLIFRKSSIGNLLQTELVKKKSIKIESTFCFCYTE